MVWEAISKTRKSVSSGIQTPRSRSKKLGCASFFQPTSRCLDILMKHSFSCLIYYMNLPRSKSESIRPLFLPSLFAFLCDFFLSVLQIDYPVSRIDHTTDDWSRIDSNRVDSTTFSTLPVRLLVWFFLSVSQIDYPVSRIDYTTDDWSGIDSNRVDLTTFSTLPVRLLVWFFSVSCKSTIQLVESTTQRTIGVESIRIESIWPLFLPSLFAFLCDFF